MNGLTISKVARSAGLAIDTVRYYGREGLLEKPARTASGYRHYTPDAVARLRFIRQAKELAIVSTAALAESKTVTLSVSGMT